MSRETRDCPACGRLVVVYRDRKAVLRFFGHRIPVVQTSREIELGPWCGKSGWTVDEP